MAHQHKFMVLILLPGGQKNVVGQGLKITKKSSGLWFCFGSNYDYLTGLSREKKGYL